MPEEAGRHGQMDEREERARQYQQWSGATRVHEDGSVTGPELASSEPDAQMVAEETYHIKQLVAQGLNVECDLQHPPTVEAIRKQLTEKELLKVSFGAHDEFGSPRMNPALPRQ